MVDGLEDAYKLVLVSPLLFCASFKKVSVAVCHVFSAYFDRFPVFSGLNWFEREKRRKEELLFTWVSQN
jgi:hypothetical protein